MEKLTKTPPKKWQGSKPTNCDLCTMPLKTTFVDGRTKMGPWGLLCPTCHASHGCGLGTGNGQKYDLKTLVKLEG